MLLCLIVRLGTGSHNPVLRQLKLRTGALVAQLIGYLGRHWQSLNRIKIININWHGIIWAEIKRRLFHWIQLSLYPFIIKMVHAWILTVQYQLAWSSFFHILKQFRFLGFMRRKVFLLTNHVICFISSVILANGPSIYLKLL